MTCSTYEAKYIAASSCICHAIWLRRLLQDIYFSQIDAIKIYVDSKSVMTLAKNLVHHEKSKHIDIHFHFIKEHVKEKNVELTYAKINDQVANIFTKPLAANHFHELKNLLGMKDGIQLSLRGGVSK